MKDNIELEFDVTTEIAVDAEDGGAGLAAGDVFVV